MHLLGRRRSGADADDTMLLHLIEAHPGAEIVADGVKAEKRKGQTFVIAWLVDANGDPVGRPARWPCRAGTAPAWNSSRELESAGSAHRLRIELWEQLESGVRRPLAAPIEMPFEKVLRHRPAHGLRRLAMLQISHRAHAGTARADEARDPDANHMLNQDARDAAPTARQEVRFLRPAWRVQMERGEAIDERVSDGEGSRPSAQ